MEMLQCIRPSAGPACGALSPLGRNGGRRNASEKARVDSRGVCRRLGRWFEPGKEQGRSHLVLCRKITPAETYSNGRK